MAEIVRVESFAVAIDHHYKVAGKDHSPSRLPGTPYYLEPAWSQVYSTQAMTCLVRVTDDNGVAGWGEAQAPIAAGITAAVVEELLGPALLGQDPHDVPALRDRLVGLMAVRGHHAGFFADAVAGVDLALWDLAARTADMPLAALVGGAVTAPVPLYVSGLRRPTLAARVDAATDLVARGFQGIKMFLAGEPEAIAAEVHAVRAAVGEDVRLMVDLLWGQRLDSAVRLAGLLEEESVEFLEAPLPLEPLADLVELASATSIPLAAGEHIHTAAEATALMAHGIRVLQPDLARTGITEGLRIAELARAEGCDVTWHLGTGSPLAVAATWSVATRAATRRLQEHQVDLMEAMGALVDEPLPVHAGIGRLASRPGTGVEVDVEAVRAVSTFTCDVHA